MSEFSQRCASIYVSYNSEKYIDKFLPRHRNELGERVIIVNSTDAAYKGIVSPGVECVEVGKNVGFAAANNIGIRALDEKTVDFYIFVNPDVLLPENWLSEVQKICDRPENKRVGVFTGPLLGYSLPNDAATGLIDSLGIYSTWYGKWFDKGQGRPPTEFDLQAFSTDLRAVCGALMVVRAEVVHDLLNSDGFFFDESYFMYKEDIEVSLRISKHGWTHLLAPGLKAYHCRGWNAERQAVPRWARAISSRNELNLQLKHNLQGLPYSLAKYLYVKLVEK